MPRKSPTESFQKALASLRKNLQPVYYLYGEEMYLQDRFLSEVYSLFEKRYNDQWAKYMYHINEAESEQILGELVSQSLFDEPKVMVIKEITELSASGKAALVDYVRNPDQNIVLVLMKDAPRMNDAFSKSIKEYAVTVEARIPWLHEMDSWLQYLLEVKNMNASQEVRAELIDLAGESIKQLENELDKIAIYIPEDTRTITIDLLRKFIGETRTHSVFEFVDVLSTKSLSKILDYLFSLLEEGVTVSYIVKITADFYIDVWTIQDMLSDNREESEINRAVFGGRNLLWKYKKFVQNFSRKELTEAFPLLEQADLTSKSATAISEKNYLTAFYYELLN